MKKTVRAFAPANISCIFKPHPKRSPRWSGSLGLGFTLSDGVTVYVSNAQKTEVFFNKKQIDMPTVMSVLKRLTKKSVLVSIDTTFLLGSGFGISGASALATAYAVNSLLNLKKTNKMLAVIAHTAEVENKTGLGDVTNQFFGGFLLKIKPSSYFDVVKIKTKEKYVYCRVFSPISTKEVLSNTALLTKIENVAAEALQAIENVLQKKNDIILQDIFAISKTFVVESGLLKNAEVKKTIGEIEKNGGNASMIILGNAVMSTIPFFGATQYEISDKRAQLL
ncbi:MAG: hypothetical protein HYV37_00725 [Candidatus Levyibacteriota bacterium]|nr:MAG: hypothetical protein HYV37_00725 [Candidatus Levybacteria bacterium]